MLVCYASDISFWNSLKLSSERVHPKIKLRQTWRLVWLAGQELPDASVPHPMDQQTAINLYTAMAKLQVMDTLFYEAQRQVLA